MKNRKRLLLPIIVTIMALVTFLFPSIALASDPIELDSVNIGDKDSEAGHCLLGWGPVEPATNGGNWGGIGSEGGNCRVTWEPGSRDRFLKRAALFVLKVPRGNCATQLELRVLDGLADDSFDVYIGCKKVYSYTGLQNGSENWITHPIDINKCASCWRSRSILVTIVATGPAWSGFGTYGQLGVDRATIYGFESSLYVMVMTTINCVKT